MTISLYINGLRVKTEEGAPGGPVLEFAPITITSDITYEACWWKWSAAPETTSGAQITETNTGSFPVNDRTDAAGRGPFLGIAG